MSSKCLLLVTHSRSGGTRRMAEAFLAGAAEAATPGVRIVHRDALQAGVADLRGCDAIVMGTPENFGSLSGALKVFLETIYDPLLEETQGLPYALFVKAGNDGSGAIASVRRIVTGLRWREVQEPILAVGDLEEGDLAACRELGAAMVAGLDLGVF